MKLALGQLGRNATASITLAALAGALTLGAGGVALAQQGAPAAPAAQPEGGPRHHGHHKGLLGQALKLSSLSDAQRTQIRNLMQTRRSAEAPVKQADAKLLTDLAAQVEQASIDKQALTPDLQSRDGAASAAHSVDRQTLQQLHDLLTPAQRGELVDAVEASKQGHEGWHGGGPRERLTHLEEKLGLSEQQDAQIQAALHADHAGHAPDGGHPWNPSSGRQAWLESFRGDSFNATSTPAGGPHPGAGPHGDHMERLMAAMVPVLTPTQRADLAAHLRRRAAHETQSHS
jgi:Spy/CpxP family protein refolding chaperone